MEKQNNIKTHLLLMMAGNGTRFGSKIPKQFVTINDEPIFIYLLKQLHTISCIDDIILITNPDYETQTKNWVKEYKINKISNIITGGNGRSKDILKGLQNLKDVKDDDIVLMYDATHPLVDVEGCEKVVEALHTWEAATLAEYQYDTVYQINKEDGTIKAIVPREEIVAGASPEGFRFKTIFDIYKNASDEELDKMTSAGAIAIKNNLKMATVQTKVVNLKITYSADYDNFCKIAKI